MNTRAHTHTRVHLQHSILPLLVLSAVRGAEGDAGHERAKELFDFVSQKLVVAIRAEGGTETLLGLLQSLVLCAAHLCEV